MCFLCMKDNPFANRGVSTLVAKRERALEIKQLIREAEESGHDKMCHIGDATVELLKQEQYELAKDL